MAIDSLQSSYLYQNPRFLQATSPSVGNKFEGNEFKAQQNRQSYGFMPSYEDMEKASAYLKGANGLEGNIFTQRTQATRPSGLQGKAFEGFQAPSNNGTGELSPVLSGREDEIEECPWEAYYA